MMAVRTGWPRSEVLKMTPSEISEVDQELNLLEERKQIMLAEAVHHPRAIADRRKVKDSSNSGGWDKLRAWYKEDLKRTNPEKARELDMFEAAKKFIGEKDGGPGS